MVGRAGENPYAEERQENDAEKARRIVAAELKRLNWTESELRRRRKGRSEEGDDRAAGERFSLVSLQ